MKRTFLTVFLIALTCGLASFGTSHFGLAQTSTQISGIVAADAIWTASGSPYILTGNTLVSKGVTLTIQPGVTINLGSFYIQVNGTLNARGTDNNPIRFNAGAITFTSYGAPWNEQTTTGSIVENSILSGTKLSSSIAAKINKSTIDTGFTVDSSTIVSNSLIKGSVNGGIIMGNTITGDVNSAQIINNAITGQITASGNATGNTVKGGITAFGNCLISNNTITGGLSSTGTNNGAAIYAGSYYVSGGGYPRIENNTIANSTVGIDIQVLIRSWFSAAIPQIKNNLITDNSVGIRYSFVSQESYGPSNSTTIQNNTITRNGIGIKFVGAPEYYQVLYNNIQANINYSMYLEGTPYPVNATNNWWGTTNTQAINQTIYDYKYDFNVATVNFIPYLNSPAEISAPAHSSTPVPSSMPTASPNPTSTLTPVPTTMPTTTPMPTQSAMPNQSPELTPSSSTSFLPTPYHSQTLTITPTVMPSFSPTTTSLLTAMPSSSASLEDSSMSPLSTELTIIVVVVVVVVAVAVVGAFFLGKRAGRSSR